MDYYIIGIADGPMNVLEYVLFTRGLELFFLLGKFLFLYIQELLVLCWLWLIEYILRGNSVIVIGIFWRIDFSFKCHFCISWCTNIRDLLTFVSRNKIYLLLLYIFNLLISSSVGFKFETSENMLLICTKISVSF